MDSVQTPVIVGVGQLLQRADDPRTAAEPLEMMISVVEQAGRDCGAPSLLQRARSIYVIRGLWGYGDPGRAIARRFGAELDETVTTPYGGNFSQACVIDAAKAIQSQRHDVVLICGAENGRTQGQAQRQGIELRPTEVPGTPDRLVAEDKPIFHPAELARGMNSASDMYSVFDSAIRHARNETIPEHIDRIARLWAGFNRVACDNPHAWIRKPYSPHDIADASPDNPMISFPYTRLMNSNPRVDMAAAVVLCSLATAREAGIPEDKLVYLQAATEANDSPYASTRAEFHRSPAMRIGGGRVLELCDKTVDQIQHVDLYSCFPSAVEIAAAELGLGEDRPLTVTGGLTFGGGPLNSYVLHAIARMVDVVRADRGSAGLVSANGGWLAKHAFGVYSTVPPTAGFRYENPQSEVDGLPTREALVDWDGPVAIEGYTVAHRAGRPRMGFASCLTEAGQRTWATTDNTELMDAMMRSEFCGRRGRVDGTGELRVE